MKDKGLPSFSDPHTPTILLTPTSDDKMSTTALSMSDENDVFSSNGDDYHNSEEMESRLNALEEKTRLQDMEIILLKSALSDVLSQLANQQNKMTNGSPAKTSTKTNVTKVPSRSNSVKAGNRLSSSSSPTTNGTIKPINRARTSSTPSSPRGSPPNGSQTPVKKRTVSKSISAKNNANRKSASDLPSPSPSSGTNSNGTNELPADNGKPKLILAPKRTAPKRRPLSSSGSLSDDNKENVVDETVKFYIRGRGLRLYRPTEYKETNPDGKAPEEQLKLDWVYGYRGKDCRDNLFIVPATGELVYNMAGVVVLYDQKTNKQRHYTEHNDDVKCIALHPKNTLIASGQVAGHGDDAKPHVRVWDASTLETKAVLGSGVFERGLCALEFSNATGQYLVCIDESNDHVAYLYDWEKNQKLTEANTSKEALFSLKWQPNTDNAFMTYGKSHIGFWKINNENGTTALTRRNGVFDKIAKPKYVICATYSPNGSVIAGDSNGNIVWFNEGTSKVSKAEQNIHKGGVFSLTYVESKDEYISGGKDNIFIAWNNQLERVREIGSLSDQYGPPRCCVYDVTSEQFLIGTSKNCIIQVKADWSEEKALVQGHSDEMWGLAAHASKPIFVTCSHENLVCVWNGEKQELIWSYFIEDGAQCAELHPSEPFVLVGTKNGTLYVLNYETKEELVTVPVSRDCIDDVKVSPNSKYLAAACRDSNIYLYNWPKEVTSFKKPKVLQGHSSRVLHLDWCTDGEFMQSNSGDYEVLFWHAESGCQVLTPAALRDTEWSTYTCPFGFPVMGIWPEGADGTDINTCCRSNNKKLVATGDDFGAVNLFKYPSVKLKSEASIGVGHSSHVTCVRFLHDDSSLITVGGLDSSIMQWKMVKS
ncbi:77 kDa echinoderm microtubule-associated protein-like isoform X2 [Clytia hemisphaerica]|uniref:Uncharacterized protein n=1 Tax=Clytia hemisphaerica TaxID=252671 RepID=A0A7M5UTY8_9CNID